MTATIQPMIRAMSRAVLKVMLVCPLVLRPVVHVVPVSGLGVVGGRTRGLFSLVLVQRCLWIVCVYCSCRVEQPSCIIAVRVL
jgi:hypothetical protein